MDNTELQKLLDSLDEGPLGTRKDYQWDRSVNGNTTHLNSKEALEKRKNSSKYKNSLGQQHSVNSKKVKVYKGTKVGNARWGTLDLIDVEYFDTFNSLGDAAKACNVTKAAVSACVNGKIRFAKGYKFEYA